MAVGIAAAGPQSSTARRRAQAPRWCCPRGRACVDSGCPSRRASTLPIDKALQLSAATPTICVLRGREEEIPWPTGVHNQEATVPRPLAPSHDCGGRANDDIKNPTARVPGGLRISATPSLKAQFPARQAFGAASGIHAPPTEQPQHRRIGSKPKIPRPTMAMWVGREGGDPGVPPGAQPGGDAGDARNYCWLFRACEAGDAAKSEPSF